MNKILRNFSQSEFKLNEETFINIVNDMKMVIKNPKRISTLRTGINEYMILFGTIEIIYYIENDKNLVITMFVNRSRYQNFMENYKGRKNTFSKTGNNIGLLFILVFVNMNWQKNPNLSIIIRDPSLYWYEWIPMKTTLTYNKTYRDNGMLKLNKTTWLKKHLINNQTE